MNANPDPAEQSRLRALESYQILDTPPERCFDELAKLAAHICRAPIAFISFNDSRRLWNKAKSGSEVNEFPGDIFVLSEGFLTISHLEHHPQSFQTIQSAGESTIRSLAAVPLMGRVEEPSPAGLVQPIGVLWVCDTKARDFTNTERSLLEMVAEQVMIHLELRRELVGLRSRQSAMEKDLRDSRTFYHSLVETIPQNIFRKDRQGRFTFANSKFCEAVGRPLSEIIGRTDFDLFPPELALKYQQDDRRVTEQKSTFRTTEQHLDAEGNTLFVQVIKSPLFDETGNIVGVQGIFWDETDRFQAESALAYERDLLRAMLDYLPDSIYFKDRASRFLAISRSLAVRLGLEKPEQATGKTDSDFLGAAHAAETFEDEQRIIRTGQPIVAKTEKIVWRDGSERWVLTTKVPLRNRQGEIIGTFGISKDISDLKETEKELAQARDAAVESARLKSEFLANMSHEIRTPLNAVIGVTGLILDTTLSEEQRDFAETIRHSAEALLNIINDILDFSKIEAGKLEIECIEFDLSEVVEGTAELLAEPAQAKGIEIASWIHEEVPKQLIGDPGRLRQVLTNLIGNAVKFTPEGEVVVDVIKDRETDTMVQLKFSVRDTGIGIPPEAQNRIFHAFVQADGSTTRKYGGTGLGLAISRQLVELMNGELGFESSPGTGSTFWFRIPFGKQSEQRPLTRMASTLEGIRVLVVDDNSTNRQIIHHQIIAWKLRNGSAEGGPKALQLLEEAAEAGDPYKLVILDMQMPAMDGLALAREISSRSHLQNPKLVMLTSMGHLPQERKWRECGISAYLVKPVKESRLYDTLVSVLRGTNSPMRSPEQVGSGTPTCARAYRVLIAEDNVVNQKVALRQLQKLGYSADAVANGVEVLRALQTVPYDIVLMDCQMPELDGYETTRQIREDESRAPERKGIYIIAMTAHALAGDRESCLGAGMDDYVSKPVRIDELQEALSRAGGYLESLTIEKKSRIKSDQLIDPTILEALRGLALLGEPDPLVEVIDLFLADTPKLLAEITAAAKAEDLPWLERSVHTLKGSASNIGSLRLPQLCQHILDLIRSGTKPTQVQVGKLSTEFGLIVPELERQKQG